MTFNTGVILSIPIWLLLKYVANHRNQNENIDIGQNSDNSENSEIGQQYSTQMTMTMQRLLIK